MVIAAISALVGLVMVVTGASVVPADAAAGTVLILSSTVTGGADSIEARAVVDAGLTPVLVDDATWAGMRASDFASHRAIILGDATCSGAAPAVAVDNAAVWGSVVGGNVVINGTDPVFHAGQGGEVLTRRAIDFSVADAARTGAYVSLSCYYHDTAAHTPVPVLDAFRPAGFTVTGVGCFDDAHVVASHPALNGLTDATLSGWGCSVHEAFDTWPSDFTVLALARDFGSSFTASDGTVGTPYILARGAGLRSFPLSVDPTAQEIGVGSTATLTAQLLDAAKGLPVTGQALRSKISSGPNAATAITCTPVGCATDSAGRVTLTYRGAQSGTDKVVVWLDGNASGTPDIGEPQVFAVVTWSAAPTPGTAYVALGDSYSAGEGNAGYEPGTDTASNACHRSVLSYPRVLAKRSTTLSDLTLAACSGATTADLFEPKPQNAAGEAAQVTRLGANTKVVTITIGGNDLGFAQTLQACVYTTELLAQGEVKGRPGCSQQRSVTQPVEERMRGLRRAGATAPDGRPIQPLSEIIARVHRASPNARLYVAGYPTMFGNFGPKPDATCHVGDAVGNIGGAPLPVPLFVRYDDAVWINSQIATVNSTLKKEVNVAKDAGLPVEFVNVSPDFNRHGLCDKSAPWLYGIVVSSSDLSKVQPDSFHPNQLGQRAYVDAFVRAGVTR